jgi:hypothetical protein
MVLKKRRIKKLRKHRVKRLRKHRVKRLRKKYYINTLKILHVDSHIKAFQELKEQNNNNFFFRYTEDKICEMMNKVHIIDNKYNYE